MDGAARRRERTRAVGATASLVLHAAVLSWLGLHATSAPHAPPSSPEPTLTLELVRDPTRARAPAAVVAAPRPPAATREAPAPLRPRPTVAAPREIRPPPLPPAATAGGEPRGAGVVPARGGPVGSGAAPGPMPAQEAQGDLRGFLRTTVGCSHEAYLRLTPAERARCDAGFATAARTAPAIPLPDDKLAAFARGADANEHRRARREGSLEQPLTGCEIGAAAASKGLGCLPPGAIHSVAKF